MKSLVLTLSLACTLAAAPAWADEPVTSESDAEQESAQLAPRVTAVHGSAAPQAAPPSTEMNSPGLLAAGVAIGGYGLTSAIVSIVAVAETGACGCAEVGGETCDMTGCQVGMAHALGGPILVLGSIPMIVAGAWQVPSDERGVPPTTAEVRVGPGNTSMAVTF